eukprot:gb/GECG01000307.1/.p1 GENE.gb/GECG01000307.1/~~gb/GECG01000307.1/.p1  ORF type:complete len:339 (+),score=32.66 gb/GECG01000307.1/:1-1017(+)
MESEEREDETSSEESATTSSAPTLSPQREGVPFVGVSRKTANSYEVKIKNKGKTLYYGAYRTPEEAARVFDNAALSLRGRDRARINFPEEHGLPPARKATKPQEMRLRREKPYQEHIDANDTQASLTLVGFRNHPRIREREWDIRNRGESSMMGDLSVSSASSSFSESQLETSYKRIRHVSRSIEPSIKTFGNFIRFSNCGSHDSAYMPRSGGPRKLFKMASRHSQPLTSYQTGWPLALCTTCSGRKEASMAEKRICRPMQSSASVGQRETFYLHRNTTDSFKDTYEKAVSDLTTHALTTEKLGSKLPIFRSIFHSRMFKSSRQSEDTSRENEQMRSP